MEGVPTTEVRWFVAGPLPPDVAAWFARLGATGEAEARTDHYLAPGSPADAGVKLRQGALEVKKRMAAGAAERLGAAEGAVEAWAKWRFASDDAAGTPGEGWVAVDKRRWLHALRFVDGRVEADDRGVAARIARTLAGDPEASVAVELSEVSAGGRPWWSVCLEATGPDELARRDALRAVAVDVFGPGTPGGLNAASSMGYPAWLMRVAAT